MKNYRKLAAILSFLLISWKSGESNKIMASREIFRFSAQTIEQVIKIPNESHIKTIQPIAQTPQKKETYATNNFYKDSDEVLLARMLLGEAEGCSNLEKIAIAYTAINRMNDGWAWNGETLKEVILKPEQYSSFNKNLNAKLKNPLEYNSAEFLSSLDLAKEILNGKYKDPTNGATHFYNPWRIKEPFWARKLQKIGRIGNSYHIFYKEN